MYKKVLIIHHKMLHFHFSVGMLFLIVCGLEALPTDNDVHGSGLFNQLSKYYSVNTNSIQGHMGHYICDKIQEDISRSPQFTSREVANRLLSRLMDVAYDTFKDLGVGQEELREVHRKRSQITACYFQAVSCY